MPILLYIFSIFSDSLLSLLYSLWSFSISDTFLPFILSVSSSIFFSALVDSHFKFLALDSCFSIFLVKSNILSASLGDVLNAIAKA